MKKSTRILLSDCHKKPVWANVYVWQNKFLVAGNRFCSKCLKPCKEWQSKAEKKKEEEYRKMQEAMTKATNDAFYNALFRNVNRKTYKGIGRPRKSDYIPLENIDYADFHMYPKKS